jgi:hypothetical protein
MPNVARLMELADIFDCDIAELLTEVSSRSSDQAKHLTRLPAGVGPKDREMIVGIVEQLTARFARRLEKYPAPDSVTALRYPPSASNIVVAERSASVTTWITVPDGSA